MVNVSVVAAWASAETGACIRAAVAGEFESALSRARPRLFVLAVPILNSVGFIKSRQNHIDCENRAEFWI